MELSVEIRFLAILTLPTLHERDLDEAKQLAVEIRSSKLLRLAKWHRVIPNIYPNIKAIFPNVLNLDEMREVEDFYRKNRYQCQQQMIALHELSTQFSHAGIPFRILKGIPMAQKLYGKPYARHCKDIDVLIPLAMVSVALELLGKIGYKSVVFDLNESSRALYFLKHKDITLIKDKNIVLELHFRICDYHLHSLDRMADRLLTTSSSSASSSLEFIYYCWHASNSMYHRLKWLADIAVFVRLSSWSEEDWENIYLYSKEYGLDKSTVLSLRLIRDLFGITVPKSHYVDDTLFHSYALQYAKSSLNMPHYSERGWNRKSGEFLKLAMYRNFSDRIAILLHRFRPSVVDILLLPELHPRIRHLYWLLRPVRVVICRLFVSNKYLKKLVNSSFP